uniref:Transmembrane protein n=1 Tax=Cacopsylla melanoneura TaxID=428564 RepID=A0A8D8VB13_9HEMI
MNFIIKNSLVYISKSSVIFIIFEHLQIQIFLCVCAFNFFSVVIFYHELLFQRFNCTLCVNYIQRVNVLFISFWRFFYLTIQDSIVGINFSFYIHFFTIKIFNVKFSEFRSRSDCLTSIVKMSFKPQMNFVTWTCLNEM